MELMNFREINKTKLKDEKLTAGHNFLLSMRSFLVCWQTTQWWVKNSFLSIYFFFNYIFFHAYCVTPLKKQNAPICKDKAKDPEYTAQQLSQAYFSLINIKQMFASNKSLKRHNSTRPAILECSLWSSIKN